MAKVKNYILGLDVGVNSVGWAVVECDIERKETQDKSTSVYKPLKLIDLNSRIFQEMVEAKTGVPKNQKRRTMRGMRRRASRLKGRREALIAYLQQLKLLPAELNENVFNQIARTFAQRASGIKEVQKLGLPERYLMNPMFMRAFALDGELQPYEFGCALLQLQKRRGYKSNRGAKYDALYEHISKEMGKPLRDEHNAVDEKQGDDDVPENGENKEEKEEKRKVLGGIEALKQEMQRRGSRTIAELVLQKAQEEHKPLERITGWMSDAKSKDVQVSLYAERRLYHKEFEALWESQTAHLTLREEDKEEIDGIIFYQRPIINPPPKDKRWKHLRYNDVGACSFFPRRRRAAKGLLVSQEFRMWQAISNIRVGKDEKLPLEEKKRLAEYLSDPSHLNDRSRMSWKEIKKLLGQNINYRVSADENEKDANSGIIGNRTEHQISDILGDKWRDYDDKKKEELVKKLLFTANKVELYKELVKDWGLSKGEAGDAFKLTTLELEPSYMKHCSDVLSELLIRMRDKGEDYYEACENLGYHTSKEGKEQKHLSHYDIPSIANPRVQKGLYEIRKLVNTIIDEYGRPSCIRLELARDLKASKKHRSLIEWRQKKNRKLNEEADRELSKAMSTEKKFDKLSQTRQGISYWSRTERSKYKMWKEQKQQCLYCGGCISINDLLDSAETEHIVPQSAFSQNYMNTVLACRNCNQEKGAATPYQAWQGTDKWERIKGRLKTKGSDRSEKCIKFPELPMPKIRRMLAEKSHSPDDESFVENQLNDTRYIAVSAKNILARLGVDVRITKGGAAAHLRDLWGLDDVLPRHPDDEILYDRIDEKTGALIEKEKAIKRGEFKQLQKIKRKGEIIKINYKSEGAAQVKNRMDHRHHAVDAFIAAMTDNGLLIRLTRLNRLMTARRFEEYEKKKDGTKIKKLETDIKKTKEKIRLPESWKGSNVMHQDVRDILVDNKIVSHQRKNNIRGALHEETLYGAASYISPLKLDTSQTTIKNIKRCLSNNENSQGQNDEATWILRHSEREALQAWVEQQEGLTAKDRQLPRLNGKTLSTTFLASRCYVVNKNLVINKKLGKAEDIKQVIKLAQDEEWKEGKGSWIKDKEIHNQLHQWLRKHKDPKQALIEDPPRMRSSKGAGNLITSVRVATIFGKDSITKVGENRIYQLGSNHHIEIFTNGKEGKDKEIRRRMVSMKEAAERKSRKVSVINKIPSSEWGEGWIFLMSLAINDMVLWNKDDRARLEPLKDLGILPILRVQNISDTAIFFRHHSISLTGGTDRHGLIQAKATTMDCQKISVDVLGNYKKMPQ